MAKQKDWMLSKSSAYSGKLDSTQEVSPYLQPKPPGQLSFLKGPLATIMIALVALLALFFYMDMPKQCVEDWLCGEWSKCDGGFQHRVCIDEGACGTIRQKPSTSQSCVAPPAINVTQPKPECTASGINCNASKACCGHCVHGYCRDSSAYCGDVMCDAGENCTICPYDCGACPGSRDLPQNVFTEPMTSFMEQDFKKAGYVIVRYFYTDTCELCKYPVDIEAQLRGMAAAGKDLFILIMVDSNEFKKEAERYSKIGAVSYTPLIRVEGAAAQTSVYGRDLAAALVDYDLSRDLEPLICGYSEYCEFGEAGIERTSTG